MRARTGGGRDLCAAAAAPAHAAIREYWVAAVPVDWNVVPNGRDAIMGRDVPASETVFPTVVYRRFTARLEAPAAERARGQPAEQPIPGPLLRARVGDRILVHFKNMDTVFKRPHSMHFHGVRYRPSSDGAYLPGFSARTAT